MAGDKQAHSFEVTQDHLDWLKEMVGKYDLPDIDKALRCLIDYGIDDGDTDQIFKEIRCLRC